MQGCFDLLLRLHNMPRMPPSLILDRGIRASLLPTQVLRASQVSIVTRIAPLSMDAVDTHVQRALDEMDALSTATAESSASSIAAVLPYASMESTASAVARAVSTLALVTELVRLLPSALDQLTVARTGGQSIMSKVTCLDLAVKALHPKAQEWMDAPEVKSAATAQHARADVEYGRRAVLPGAIRPDVAAKVASTLVRVSPKEARITPSKSSTTPPLLQLPALLQNAEHNVRLFHAAVCKCVHHPTTRYRRGGSSPAVPAVDTATGCILTYHTRLALAFLAQGRKNALDAASAIQPAGGFDSSDPRSLMRMMWRLAACGEDTRVCLFEMRRKEYYSLTLAYFNAVGGFASLAARFSDAISAACVAFRQAAQAKAAAVAVAGRSHVAAGGGGAAAEGSGAGPAGGAAMDAEDTPPASSSPAVAGPTAVASAPSAGRPSGAGSNPKTWADAAAAAAPMLSTFLTLFSLLLHRRSLLQQSSASLMGHALPKADGSSPLSHARASREVVLEIEATALRAVLELWQAISSSPTVAQSVPAGLLSHLVSTLSIAYAAKADKSSVGPASAAAAAAGRGNASALAAAAAAGVRTGSPWGPARDVARPAFVPSEAAVTALSDGMGFPRNQVEFVMNRISSNEVPLLANYFLEHDVESLMRAEQAAPASGGGAGDDSRAASAVVRARGTGAGGSGDAVVQAAAAGAEDAPMDGTCSTAEVNLPGDMLAQALTKSENEAADGSAAHASSRNEVPSLPTVADLGDGAMCLCIQDTGHVFLLAPLIQQATHAAPDPAMEWISTLISTLLPVWSLSRTYDIATVTHLRSLW